MWLYPSTFIPADNAHIQYFGRWDTTDALHPRHSWPGVQIYAEFSGSSIGVRLIDNTNFYNVYIDGSFHSVFHGDKSSEADYVLVDGLKDTRHTLLFSKRNISFDKIFTFSGFLLDDGASLFPPPPKPERKIEFIGDSFTAAEGNEAQEQMMPWEKKFPVTNIDKGFAADIARHFKAQYHTTCRSGIGMVCDWQGKFDIALPKRFDRTLMEASEPKWDFKEWIPDLVVICLGLNDSSGLKEKTGEIPEEQSAIFRKGYHDFLATIRGVYPNVRILAVAAHPEWIRNNVRQVVDEEAAEGHADVFYTQFDYFPGGYVANGHPTVETHQKIADQIIKGIDAIKLFAEREK